MNLSIIITTFNSADCIKGCLDSLFLSLKKEKNYEVIIIDNNSSDETLKLARLTSNDFIKIISNPTNKGYSKSINEGVLNIIPQKKDNTFYG